MKRPTQTAPGVSFASSQLITPSADSDVHVVPGLVVSENSVAVVGAVTPPANRSASVALSLGWVSDRLFSVLLTVTVYSM